MDRTHLSLDGVFLFGKHKDKTLREVADSDDCAYLEWMLTSHVGTVEERRQVEDAIDDWKRRHRRQTFNEACADDASWN